MMFFVYINGRFCGTVIARTNEDAWHLAYAKFPTWGYLTVSGPRRR